MEHEVLQFYFSGAEGVMSVRDTLTAGMVGKEIRFAFTKEWDGLTKTLLYTAGNVVRAVPYRDGGNVIPADVLTQPGQRLNVGVLGESADGHVVIPTIMAAGPVIREGADVLSAPSDPDTLSVHMRLTAQIGDLDELKTSAKSNLVAAINEAAQSGGTAVQTGELPAIYSMRSNHPVIAGAAENVSIAMTIDGFPYHPWTSYQDGFSVSVKGKRSDYIEITDDMVSILASTYMGDSGYAVAFYDAEKNILEDISVAGTATNPQAVSVDLKNSAYANARYFIAACYSAVQDFSPYSCTATCQTGGSEPDYGLNVLIFGDSITDSANITVDANGCTSAYATRTISYVNAAGETVTYNKWPNLIGNVLDCRDIRNYALSGASYKDQVRESGAERMNLSYQVQVALNDVGNPNGVFPSDSFEPDIIIFALGTNDGVPNDTPDSALSKTVTAADGYSIDADATLAALDRSKFCEAAMWAFLTVKKAFPMALGFCVLPIQRAANEANTGTLHEYLGQMAKRYGYVVVDGAYESGIIRDLEVNNGLGTALKDGLHPNEMGQNLLTRLILTAIRQYYLPFDALN